MSLETTQSHINCNYWSYYDLLKDHPYFSFFLLYPVENKNLSEPNINEIERKEKEDRFKKLPHTEIHMVYTLR